MKGSQRVGEPAQRATHRAPDHGGKAHDLVGAGLKLRIQQLRGRRSPRPAATSAQCQSADTVSESCGRSKPRCEAVESRALIVAAELEAGEGVERGELGRGGELLRGGGDHLGDLGQSALLPVQRDRLGGGEGQRLDLAGRHAGGRSSRR